MLRGAAAVAGQTLTIALPSAPNRPVLVNGAAGVVITLAGQPVAVMGFAISGDKITEIDAITDAARLAASISPPSMVGTNPASAGRVL